MAITWPVNTKEVIDEIRGVIGRAVLLNITATTSGCSLCRYDPINNVSTNPFCSGCDGAYWIVTTDDINISGHVRWTAVDTFNPQPGGVIQDGDCIVTIEYTSGNLEIVKDRLNYVTVDDRTLDLDRYILRGKPEINRIRMVLKERE